MRWIASKYQRMLLLTALVHVLLLYVHFDVMGLQGIDKLEALVANFTLKFAGLPEVRVTLMRVHVSLGAKLLIAIFIFANKLFLLRVDGKMSMKVALQVGIIGIMKARI